MDDDASLLTELLRHMPADVRARSPEERRAWLKRAANHIREQRKQDAAVRAFRDAARADYVPLDARLSRFDAWNAKLPDTLEAAGPGVYSFPLLDRAICTALLAELANVEQWAQARGLAITRPNSMNRYGLILDDIGYRHALEEMMRSVVEPLAQRVYPDVGRLGAHHGFLVEYEVGKDLSLDLHVDDAEVTLNVCLGDVFAGGDLGFAGVRCPDHVTTSANAGEEFDVAHVPGRAILHHGRHRHRALPLESGHRVNLILWCRSEVRPALRPGEAACPPWCGVAGET